MGLRGSARGPTRHRPSSIDRLDPQIKDLIGKLRIDQGWTIDEILTRLQALEANVSRSALGRHVKSLEEIGAQLRHSREVANALVARVGDAPEDKTAELNIELMQNMVLRMLTATDDEGDGQPIVLKASEALALSKSIQSLAGARKTNVDMILKARDAATREAAKKAVNAAKSKGLSGDTVEFIRKAVLGSGE